MQNKRILALTLAVLMVVGLLAACKPAAVVEDPVTPEEVEEIIELNVLNYIDMTNANSSAEIEVVWDAFEAAHPGIKINREDAFNDPYHEKLEAYAAAGELPDVMYAWPRGRSSTLHNQHLLYDLGPLVARDGLASLYQESVMNPAGQAGNYLAIIPQGATATSALYVNTAILDECGLKPAKTYAELVEQVAVLKAAGKQTIIMANASDAAWVMQSCLFSLVAGRFCGAGWDEKVLNGSAKLTDDNFVAALTFIAQLYKDGVIDKSTLSVGYGDSVSQFATGEGAYMIDGDWRAGAFITDKETGEALISPEDQEKIIITSFPEIEGATIPARTNSVELGTGWAIRADIPAEKLEAAWELVKWLSGVEVLTFRLANGGLPAPSRVDINFDALNLEPIQVAIAKLGDSYDLATCVFDGSFDSSIAGALNDGLQNLGLGKATPEEVAESLQTAFEAWKAA